MCRSYSYLWRGHFSDWAGLGLGAAAPPAPGICSKLSQYNIMYFRLESERGQAAQALLAPRRALSRVYFFAKRKSIPHTRNRHETQALPPLPRRPRGAGPRPLPGTRQRECSETTCSPARTPKRSLVHSTQQTLSYRRSKQTPHTRSQRLPKRGYPRPIPTTEHSKRRPRPLVTPTETAGGS